MQATSSKGSFADSVFARLIAAALAVGVGVLFYANWSDDLGNFFKQSDAPSLQAGQVDPREVAKPENTALAACLEQRVGDVDKMKEEGIINDAQYTAFKARASDLCYAQNPS